MNNQLSNSTILITGGTGSFGTGPSDEQFLNQTILKKL